MKRDPLPHAVAPGAGERLAPAWRAALPALAAAFAVIGVAFAGTAASMVGTWAHSETFAHGFVVLPICAWLVWRIRDHLRDLEPQPSWRALPFIAVAGFAWLLGEFAAVNALSQAAFVAMLVLAVPAILGERIARAMLFPLGFLFFAVPLGDFLLPTLMDRTADFTVAALRATGVPVYREGLLLVIPTGRWSIVEACSGVRYLIASLLAGTLFAYLNYRSLWRRWAFVGFSIVMPIVANWIRAYLIVLLGHLSNNKLAAGVDHLIYGWIFFGFVMLLMFWIGSRWREAPAAAAARAFDARMPAAPASRLRAWPAAVAVMALAVVWPLADSAADAANGDSGVALEIGDVPGWRSTPAASGIKPRFASPSAEFHATLRHENEIAHAYVAYYRGQTSERKLVSSDNALIRSENRAWLRTGYRAPQVRLGGATYRVDETTLRGVDGRSLIAWQWYWIDGTITSSDALAKARIGWSKLTRQRDDAAVIIFYAEDGDGVLARDTLQRFTRDAWPVIAAALARAGERR